jgi:hypothetical protein
MKRRDVIAVVLLTGPLLAATGGTLWVAALERSDPGFFPQGGPRNSAEAAAAGNAAAMLQFLRLDNDATRVHPVRPEIISAQVQRATTLEASMWSRREEIVRLLDREGFIVDDEERRHLACLAHDLELPAIAGELVPGYTCVEGDTLKKVIARSRGEAGTR